MKVNKVIRTNSHEMFFFLGLTLLLIQYVASVTSRSGIEFSAMVNSALTYSALILWLIAMYQKYTIKQFFRQTLILAFLFLNDLIVESSLVLIAYTMIFASKEIPFDKIIRFIFRIYSVVLTYLIVLYSYNMARGNAVITKYRTVDGVKTARYGFYFNQPNSFSMVLFFTFLMFVYLNYNKLNKIILYAVMVGEAIFIYCFPNTKTVAYICILLIFFDMAGSRYWSKIPYFVKYILRNAMVFMLILNVGIVLLYRAFPSNRALRAIDDLFSWRPRACVSALKMYGIPVIGQSINQGLMGYDYMCIDNFYWALLITFGVVTSLLIMYPFHKTLVKKKEYSIELFCMISFLLYGFTELVVCPLYAFPILFMRSFILGEYKGKNHEQENNDD